MHPIEPQEVLKLLEDAVKDDRNGQQVLNEANRAAAPFEERGVFRSGACAKAIHDVAVSFGYAWSERSKRYEPPSTGKLLVAVRQVTRSNSALDRALHELETRYVALGYARRLHGGRSGLTFWEPGLEPGGFVAFTTDLRFLIEDHGYRFDTETGELRRTLTARFARPARASLLLVGCLVALVLAFQGSRTPETAARVAAIAAVGSVLAALLPAILRSKR